LAIKDFLVAILLSDMSEGARKVAPLIYSLYALPHRRILSLARLSVLGTWLWVGCSLADAQAVSTNPPPEILAAGGAAAADAERVIVTGSHIPTAAEVGPNPVQELDRDYIDKAPARTAEQLLRDLPAASANGVPLSNNGNGFAPGASSISLRGFDASATLVLIDGRRVAPYPVGTGSIGTQTFIDLNSIPLAAVESFEILKDGASTTYGADAVAGVVNIKIRHD
jgi:iron complex outermembrane receptor protein